VKPSGGIRDLQRARLFIDMGVHRLGVNYTSTSTICRTARGDTGESD
jgi:deoxyribose-phosphate aldolase